MTVTGPLLITGSAGLIGSHLRRALNRLNVSVKGFDNNESLDARDYGDVTDYNKVEQALAGVSGVVHLAAVSRVIWGEQDPKKCQQVNVQGTENVLKAASKSSLKPWVIYASSREVYGQQARFPVTENVILKPCNFYAHTKVAAEKLTKDYRQFGLNTAILRFSNVYGWVKDHPDRVLPAFCRRAAQGLPLVVEGKDNLFDFTYIDDVVRGILLAIHQLNNRIKLPDLHFTTGRGMTLDEAARLAVEASSHGSSISYSNPRHFDVAMFVGDPSLAKRVLNWEPSILPKVGIKQFVNAFLAS